MFTIEDIRDIAVQIERNGHKAYRLASRKVKDDSLAKMLAHMADEEKEHEKWFQDLTPTRAKTDGLLELETMGRELLRDMMQDQTFSLDADELADDDTLLAIVSRALEFENDTILFYEMLCGFLDDSEAVGHLEAIIAEERQHAAAFEKRKKQLANRK